MHWTEHDSGRWSARVPDCWLHGHGAAIGWRLEVVDLQDRFRWSIRRPTGATVDAGYVSNLGGAKMIVERYIWGRKMPGPVRAPKVLGKVDVKKLMRLAAAAGPPPEPVKKPDDGRGGEG